MLFEVSFKASDQGFNAEFGAVATVHNGQNGATFTPSVSEDGVLSWSNDRELDNPEPRARLKMLLNLVPTTICMVITISVMLSLKESLGPAEIFEGLMKLSALPIIGIRGYVCGFSYAKEVRAGWLETKSRLLEGFLSGTGLTNTA